jgi:Uncharacterized protein conserved in bacteria
MIINWFRGEGQAFKKFKSSDFECKCGNCVLQAIESELVDKLEQLDVKIVINSGFRCYYHNRSVGGKEHSNHLKCLAADIYSPDVQFGFFGKVKPLFKRIGVGKNFLHVDIEPGEAIWYY